MSRGVENRGGGYTSFQKTVVLGIGYLFRFWGGFQGPKPFLENQQK